MKRLWIALTILVSISCGLGAATLSSLTPGIAINGTDLFYDVQVSGTGGVRVTASQVKTFTSASPTFSGTVLFPDSSSWTTGGLTGTSAIFTTSSIATLTGTNITFTNLTATNGSIVTLTGTSVNVANLTSTNGNYTNLTATNGSVGTLTGTNASFATITFTSQLVSAGGKPSVFACGTSPTGAVSATSTNQSGSLQTGGTATITSCGIGFSTTLSSTPRTCTIVAESSSAASDLTQTFVSALTAGGWTLSAVNTLNTATFGYICL